MHLRPLQDFAARCHLHQQQCALLLTMMFRRPHLCGTRRGDGTRSGPTTTRGRRRLRMTCPRLLGWQGLTYEDNVQVHDPWRTPRAQHVHAYHSWQLGPRSEEPSLPSPRPAGPCPGRCMEPPPPLAEEVTNHLPGLRSGGRPASHGITWGSLHQFDSILLP